MERDEAGYRIVITASSASTLRCNRREASCSWAVDVKVLLLPVEPSELVHQQQFNCGHVFDGETDALDSYNGTGV